MQSQIENSATTIPNQEAIIRSSKRPKLEAVQMESDSCLADQVDFQDMFCIQSPRMPDEPEKCEDTNSLPVVEKHTLPRTSVGLDDFKSAETFDPYQDESTNMSNMFQRIEAIYI